MKSNHKKTTEHHHTIPFFWTLVFLTLGLASCKKFLDIPPPNSLPVTTSVFNNNGAATSAELAIYVQMFQNSESYNMADDMGIYADELQNFDNAYQSQVQLYRNSLLAKQNPNWGTYGNGGFYNYIYEANAVISGLQTTAGASAAVKQQLTGEAYFMRAFWHFYLTNIYGDVPLVLTINYTTNKSLARTPRVQVLQQVVNDLNTAEGLLNVNYVDATDTSTTANRVRPNKAVAEALLARAELYLADYDKKNMADYKAAETAATTVITNSAYSLSPLSGVFLANSSEAIWQLQTISNVNYDTPEGYGFILLAAPNTGGNYNCTTISTQLMNAFEPNDQRKSSWIGSITEGTTTFYFPYKYKNYTLLNTEYDMVLRLGEQYLIRAEARAEQNNIAGALQDLNIIRSRAGLPDYSGTQDQVSVLTAILHERQVELFTEWGARWFDLERAVQNDPTGVNANTVLGSPGNVCAAKGGTWNADGYQLLLPVPQSERTVDFNLTQNPGY